jgi:hypothetical protein
VQNHFPCFHERIYNLSNMMFLWQTQRKDISYSCEERKKPPYIRTNSQSPWTEVHRQERESEREQSRELNSKDITHTFTRCNDSRETFLMGKFNWSRSIWHCVGENNMLIINEAIKDACHSNNLIVIIRQREECVSLPVSEEYEKNERSLSLQSTRCVVVLGIPCTVRWILFLAFTMRHVIWWRRKEELCISLCVWWIGIEGEMECSWRLCVHPNLLRDVCDGDFFKSPKWKMKSREGMQVKCYEFDLRPLYSFKV